MSRMSTQNQFYEACRRNDLRSASELVKYRDVSGFDINYRYEKGATDLMHVAAHGYTEIVRLLLDCTEIDVDIENDAGYQAIHRSVQYGYPDILELLLCKGASVNTQTAPGLTWSGTPLKLACECLRGKSEQTPGSPARDFTGCVQVLLNHGADVNLADVDRWTPLHSVCRYGNNIDIVNLLLSHGVNINKQENEGTTALNLACQEGFTSAVDVLLTHKADPDKADNEGFTPLMIASQEGHLSCVEMLVKHKANINAQNNAGATALMLASIDGQLLVVKLLIHNGATVNIESGQGITALYYACYRNQTEVAEYLIRASADTSLQDNNDFTPLAGAASLGHVSCVELLLSSGSKLDWTGKMSPLALARTKNHTEVVRVLERFRADSSSYVRSPSMSIISDEETDSELSRFRTLAVNDVKGKERGVVVEQGGNATFVATVDGKPEPDITWRRNGQLLSQSSNIRIEKKPNRVQLLLSKCTLDLSGKIAVQATNCHGAASVHWSFQVNEKPVKPTLENIHPQTILADEEAVFSTTVTGKPSSKATLSLNSARLDDSHSKVVISASGPNHKLELNKIKPGKHTVTVVASNLCGKVEQTAQLEVKVIYLNNTYDVCFCESCHAARGDNLKYPRGNPPMNYGLPIGWCKFGIHTKRQAIAKNVFKDWHVAFHGTKVENVTDILDVGDFLLPGDMPPSGPAIGIPENHFKPDHKNKKMRPPPGHDTQKFYFSPSIRYAGLEVYAPVWGWKNPRSGKIYKVRTAFQVRIEPGSYDVSKHTVRATGHIDPLFPNSQLEWSTKRRGVSMLVGLLVKIERGMMEADVGTLQQIMKGEKHEEQAEITKF